MTLYDLIGPIPALPAIVGRADHISRFVMGGNDEPNCGDCVLVACANGKLVTTGERMADGEIENAYSKITGWMPRRPETDHGARISDVLDFWRDKGWPSDPEDKISGYTEIILGELHAAIHVLGWTIGWAMLPMAGVEFDFTDAALSGPDGVAPHCMAFIRSTPEGLTAVTWAARQPISRAWWTRFGQGMFAVK